MNYSAGIWPGYNGERSRWAVLCHASYCWYFPRQYGERAARKLAAQLNRRG